MAVVGNRRFTLSNSYIIFITQKPRGARASDQNGLQIWILHQKIHRIKEENILFYTTLKLKKGNLWIKRRKLLNKLWTALITIYQICVMMNLWDTYRHLATLFSFIFISFITYLVDSHALTTKRTARSTHKQMQNDFKQGCGVGRFFRIPTPTPDSDSSSFEKPTPTPDSDSSSFKKPTPTPDSDSSIFENPTPTPDSDSSNFKKTTPTPDSDSSWKHATPPTPTPQP